ncbi:lymphocyte antigen 86 [Varanus komodoensis]|uniref:Lymphocyte antigen 86 n=1 Tax=Varanus komodoensis TaxID=61221 RepID=A0A8D2IPC5_VARKO|nr:lymphocyte antigen 86 [Varanus komodoensis]
MLKVALHIFLLIYTATSITRWPTRTICKNSHLEIKYRSCDPTSDFAFSLSTCSAALTQSVTIRIATILRYSITELSIDVKLDVNGNNVPIYSTKLCERHHPKYNFCGKKKGEYIHYEGPVPARFNELPQGNFNVTVQLFNQDHHTIICAELFIRNQGEVLAF